MDSAETSSRPDLQAVKQRRVTLRVSTEHLTAALGAATAEPAGTSWANILTAALELQTCLSSHIDATEGPGGFHAEMVAAAPRLAHEVAILASEHSKLAALVADIVSAQSPRMHSRQPRRDSPGRHTAFRRYRPTSTARLRSDLRGVRVRSRGRNLIGVTRSEQQLVI